VATQQPPALPVITAETARAQAAEAAAQATASAALPVAGGNLTGALVGTSAAFSVQLTAPALASTPNTAGSIAFNTGSGRFDFGLGSSIANHTRLTGDTMTGALTLSGAPTASLHAATKGYVDAASATYSAGIHIQSTLWNASTNSPALSSGGGGASAGALYYVGTAGTTALDGNSSWSVGDALLTTGAAWIRFPANALYAPVVNPTFQTAATAPVFTLSGGGSVASLSLIPNIASATLDAAGNVGPYVRADGGFVVGTLYAAGLQVTSISGVTLTTSTLNGGSITNQTSVGFASGDNFALLSLIPYIGFAIRDAAGNISAFADQSGAFNFSTLNAVAATVQTLTTYDLVLPNGFSPTAITVAGATTAALTPLVPDVVSVSEDASGNIAGMIRAGGDILAPFSSSEVAKSQQAYVTRSFRMTQGPPTLYGSTQSTADGGPSTYHTCMSLDTTGFDAVRLLISCGQPTAGNSLKAVIAASDTINDYLNPTNNGSAGTWVPVTFNNNGTDEDWFDQPLGAFSLPLSVLMPSGNVLSFASGVSAVQIGAPVFARGVLPGTVVTATNPSATPQTVTLSQNTDGGANYYQSPVGTLVWFGNLIGTLQPNGLTTAVTITPSDWIPLSSLNRADGGLWPLLMARVYVGGTPYPLSGLVSGTLHSAFSNTIGDRVFSCYSATGDAVTTTSGFSPGADNGKSMILAVQFMSRSRGVFTFGVGDSVIEGFAAIIAGIGGLALSHMRLSTPQCPVTQIVLPNGWSNSSGTGVMIWPTAKSLLTLLKPNVLALQTWSRNDFLETLAFTQADADWQWQQNMMLAEKASAWGCQTLFYGAWPNTTMTSANEPIRTGNNARAAQFASGGGMFQNNDAIIGTGTTPVNTQATWALNDGLHCNAEGQNAIATSMDQMLKKGIGL
jgi:hypothetical protein